jgi:hypothetical protein
MSTNRWKYLTVRVSVGWSSKKTDERLQAELDQYGAQGWELTGMATTAYGLQLVFRKPA